MTQLSVKPIAIVGMGVRLPGNVSTPEEFWKLLIDKKDGRCRVPRTRFDVDGFYDKDFKQHQQTLASDHGYFLEHANLKTFDAPFFSMGRSEVETLDPQQRLLLEVVWECMENAGLTNWRGTKTGVYVGVFSDDYRDSRIIDTQTNDLFGISGSSDFALSNRISYEYNLKGPSMTIRTACSSSLIGLHEACQALYRGECSAAIVAGASLLTNPCMGLTMTRQGVLSPTGSCKSFDAAADGYARGEAINAVYIKLLDDAIRDGDPIRAVIRSTAVNCDGKTQGLSLPSVEMHEAMMRRAYDVCGIKDISQTPFVECHGTGTQIGDPLETTAVANVFGGAGTYIGSVKPNVGHSEGASGITSLIKAVLALENETIPPNINFSNPNPKSESITLSLHLPPHMTDVHPQFPLSEENFKCRLRRYLGPRIVRRESASALSGLAAPTRMWVQLRPSRASLLLIHLQAIIESAASFAVPHTNGERSGSVSRETYRENGYSDTDEKHWPRLLPLSANNVESLRRRVEDMRGYVLSRPGSIDAIAHTLGTRRDHLLHRSFCIYDNNKKQLDFSSPQKPLSTAPDIVFVFTGQGAQWQGMGKHLIQSFPSFSHDVAIMDQALQSIDQPPQWRIKDILCSDESGHLLDQAEYAQPLSTAVQIALVNLLARCGVKPSAVVGHSSGEVVAAYAAGALSATEAILTAYYRGLATRIKAFKRGGMAAVGLGRGQVSPLVADGAVIACENSPDSVTLSGDEGALERSVDAIKARYPTAFTRRLRVDVAYHSSLMHEAGNLFLDMTKPRGHQQTTVPFYSSLTGKLVPIETQLPRTYWRDNLVSPVLFNTAVTALLHDLQRDTIFLEVGPHSALQGPLRQIFKPYSGKSVAYASTLTRGVNTATSFLTAVGQLYAFGYEHVDFSFINPKAAILTDLPNYPWDHRFEYWKESRVTKAWREKKHTHHELLGSRCLESSDAEPAWRNVLKVATIPWLTDYLVANDIEFPCAAYIATLGEAIRQSTGADAYTLRNIVVLSPLVLQESDEVELLTTMKPIRLTHTLNSSWFEFSISSFNGTSWTKNFVAEGKASEETTFPNQKLQPFVRRVSEDVWYQHMGQLGLNLGPQFRGLQDISAHTTERKAAAKIGNASEARYSAHPTTLDHCMQLSLVAMANGVARRVPRLMLPSAIGLVCVNPGPSRLTAEATSVSRDNEIKSSVVAVDDSNVVLKFEKITFAPCERGNSPSDSKLPLACRLQWRPHIDFLDTSRLAYQHSPNLETNLLLERYAMLCILQIADAMSSIDAGSGSLASFAAWIQAEKESIARDETSEAREFAKMDAAAIASLRNSLGEQLQAMPDNYASAVERLCRRIAEHGNIEKVLGETDAADRLIGEQIFDSTMDWADFFSLYANARPAMKVLQIGVGSGDATRNILKSLETRQGHRLYSQFTCVEASPELLEIAKERLQGHDKVECRLLDISQDPAKQGFDLGCYDVVVASNVGRFRMLISSLDVLCNIRSLLRPGGRLLLQDLVRPRWRWVKLVTEFFDMTQKCGFFSRESISEEQWDKNLREAGFSGYDAMVPDEADPHRIDTHIIATAVESTEPSEYITFLSNSRSQKFAVDVACRLEKLGFRIRWTGLDEESIPGQSVVSFLDIEDSFFHEIQKSEYVSFMAYMSTFKGRMLWLTRSAQICCTDPRFGQTIGLARTIRSELGVSFSTVELQEVDSEAAETVVGILQYFQSRSSSEACEAEQEFAVHQGVVYAGRYHWSHMSEETERAADEESPRYLTTEQFGSLDKLSWLQHQSSLTDIEDDEVELDVRCVGLNFRDLLIAMGIIDSPQGNLGFEASGVVKRIGTAVTNVKVGDRVMAMSTKCFSTQLRAHHQLVFPLPHGISFEDGASIPVAFLTVVHSLINVGQLKKGQVGSPHLAKYQVAETKQSVLIHSACGGVGLAAIQVCQMLGAEIYATVGNEEKIQFLTDNYGLSRDRIFDSRSTSFARGILNATASRGVDVVLNSLSGEMLHASWQCVAKHGKMVELGKRDLLGCGNLALEPFLANRTFHGIDMVALAQDRPDEVQSVMKQVFQYVQQGYLKPIRRHDFPASKVSDAFRYMQSGKHIGKIVVTLPEAKSLPAINTSRRQYPFSNESTYLLVGGLGGLGKAVATWIVERGARNLLFLSRSAGKSSEDQGFLRELESQGCRAVAFAGDVSDLATVQKAVKAAPTAISGVLQTSMVLRDRPLLKLSHEDWEAVQKAKVKGTWNLHEALSGIDLDFFVLFGSFTAAFGNPGQANYVSANTFLDSFVQYRHGLKLPCSVLGLGAMEGIGYLSRNAAVGNQFRESGAFMMQETQMLEALQIVIDDSQPGNCDEKNGAYRSSGHVIFGLNSTKALSDPSNRIPWKRDIRMSLYQHVQQDESSVGHSRDDTLHSFIKAVVADPKMLDDPTALELLTKEIGRAFCAFMALSEEDLDVRSSLSSMGLDSLVAIEFRNWWSRTLGVDISVVVILSAGTVEKLGKKAIVSLKEKNDG
ncbi:hypothetical protein CP532_0333 [Ophiocordyceps camponoti-leonardi (nom. inval.)]|nr:hypothetical protein CP532_0333 [Ophiocordyceps camponoti-leonardi (nom. inval.)]